jgi:general secretion pathway protein K
MVRIAFSLGSLITVDGRADVAGRRQFEYLMGSLGIPEYKSKKISYSLSDWMDADTQRELLGAEDGDYLRRPIPHRTPNSIISSVMELRSIEGIDENIYKRIRPHICVRMQGSRTKFNINTSEAKTLFYSHQFWEEVIFTKQHLQLFLSARKRGMKTFKS